GHILTHVTDSLAPPKALGPLPATRPATHLGRVRARAGSPPSPRRPHRVERLGSVRPRLVERLGVDYVGVQPVDGEGAQRPAERPSSTDSRSAATTPAATTGVRGVRSGGG